MSDNFIDFLLRIRYANNKKIVLNIRSLLDQHGSFRKQVLYEES